MAKKRKHKKPTTTLTKCPPEDLIKAVDLAHKAQVQISDLSRHLSRIGYKNRDTSDLGRLVSDLFDDYFNSTGSVVGFDKRKFCYKK
jgi:hypothetical protein